MLQIRSVDSPTISSDLGSFASHHSDASTVLTNKPGMCCAHELVSTLSRLELRRHVTCSEMSILGEEPPTVQKPPVTAAFADIMRHNRDNPPLDYV